MNDVEFCQITSVYFTSTLLLDRNVYSWTLLFLSRSRGAFSRSLSSFSCLMTHTYPWTWQRWIEAEKHPPRRIAATSTHALFWGNLYFANVTTSCPPNSPGSSRCSRAKSQITASPCCRWRVRIPETSLRSERPAGPVGVFIDNMLLGESVSWCL